MQNVAQTIASQYGTSPALTTLIAKFDAAIDPHTLFQNALRDILEPNTAIGYGLDRIGRIVGIGRVIQIPGTGTYLGFQSSTGTASGVGFNQAPFYSGQALTSNYALTDAAYLTLIQAKMLINISNNSIPAINNILMTLFGAGNGSGAPTQPAAYCTEGNMTMTYTLSFVPTNVQLGILLYGNVLPRPCGVSVSVVHP